ESERNWSPAELDALYTAANILGAAIQNENVQDALRSNLQFLETFLDTIPNPAFYKDASGVYHGCNAAFSQLVLGLPKREILGRSIQDFPDIIPESLANMLHQKDLDLLKTPGGHLHEATIKCTDGHTRDFLFNETTFIDSDGNVIGICGVMSDITDMKQAEEELARARQQEINIGFEIQSRLLLGRPPEGLSGAKIAAMSLPSQQIDGDFYDFVKYDNEHFDLMLGDVMGKGVSAALLGAATKTQLLRAIGNLVCSTNLATLPTPEEIMDFIHSEMCEKLMTLNSFATLCLARFALDKNRMDLVDAGHTQTIHYRHRTGTCNLIKSNNLPLGFDLAEKYEQISVHFEPGDIILFYSDGLVETSNSSGERFSTDRVAQFVQTHASLSPSELIKELYGELVHFATSVTFQDDLTYVAVKIEPHSHNTIVKRERRQISSEMSELATVREFLKTVLKGFGRQLDVKFLGQLELATSEATSNIIKHAYEDDEKKFIDIEVTVYDDRIVVCLYHWGQPLKKFQMMTPAFDGSQDNGFGLYFIRNCVDEVHYSTDDDGLTCVRLVKQIRKPDRT
ncbi:MAG: SpoIIE family protein phosphatase, partial [Phycisphaerae bacterium]|nr:SpoIIE family protein phosphatase [Phycisphaerae bacterium]